MQAKILMEWQKYDQNSAIGVNKSDSCVFDIHCLVSFRRGKNANISYYVTELHKVIAIMPVVRSVFLRKL